MLAALTEILTASYKLGANYNFIFRTLVFANMKIFTESKKYFDNNYFLHYHCIIILMKAIKTMSDIAKNQKLAINILPLLLGIALLRLLLLIKAACPSFLGHH